MLSPPKNSEENPEENPDKNRPSLTQPPLITLVIVNYNTGVARLSACLRSIANQEFTDFAVCIVDNASTDDSRTTPLPDERFYWVDAGANHGFPKGNNIGVDTALGRYVMLLNPDTIMQQHALSRLLAIAEAKPEIAMVGARLVCAEDVLLLDGVGDCYSPIGIYWRGGYRWLASQTPPSGYVFAACAAAFLVRREVWQEVGGMPDEFFLNGEDVDVSFRIRLCGYEIWQENDAVIIHEGSAIIGRQSDFGLYHGVRNRLWVFIRNMPDVFLPLLPLHLLASFLLGLKHWRQWPVQRRAWRDSFIGLKTQWRARQVIQAQRRVSAWRVALWLVWWPPSLLRRAPKIWR